MHGTFDPLHYGHLRLFEAAKKMGTSLIVTLTADIFVNKGPGRPIFSQGERAYCIMKNKDVDQVEICFHKSGIPMIEKWRPDLYVKGADYETEDKHGFLEAEKEVVESYGGRLVLAQNLPRFSSTVLIERIAQWNEARR